MTGAVSGKHTANPGSDEAVAQGCTCPVMDNRRGAGITRDVFWINDACPLHGIDAHEATLAKAEGRHDQR